MKQLLVSILLLALPLLALPGQVAAESGLQPEETLRIGIFPRRDPLVTIRLFKPLQTYLEEQLGIPVKLETASSFSRFEDMLEQNPFDLVHFNQCHYIEAHESTGYEVIAQNEEFGKETLSGAIFVRKDSGINSLEQLKGKRILFGGGQKAMISYVVPRYLLIESGIQPVDYTERFAKSPPNALLALHQGLVDASGAGAVVAQLPLVTEKIDTSQLTMLAQSAPLSHLPWAVKPDMDAGLKAKIRSLLIGLKDSDAGREILKAARLTALNPARDSDYDEHRAIIDVVTRADAGQ